MKIAVMLRHYNQHGGGIKVHTQNLLNEMLKQNTKHDFVLLYRNPELIGTHAYFKNIREIYIRAPSIIAWDQLAVKFAEKREKFDLIFNPKSSVPLTAKCKTVFVSHGLQWAVVPMRKPWTDYISHKFLIPQYAKKADAVITVSNTTRQNLIDYLGVKESLVHNVYMGVDERFKKPINQKMLDKTKKLFRLPERYFLYVGQIYPPKNFGRLVQAYARVGPKMGISLVVAGEHRYYCNKELELINKLGISKWVLRVDWVRQEFLPAFYSLAEALCLPSLYESFGLPILEAMATGCPVITSNRYGMKEVADQAGLLVDPESIESIANGLYRIAIDKNLKQKLENLGRQRSRDFSWEKCAKQTLAVFDSVLKSG
jgi:glycosyltransferase involved in cell wall biosynthesis